MSKLNTSGTKIKGFDPAKFDFIQDGEQYNKSPLVLIQTKIGEEYTGFVYQDIEDQSLYVATGRGQQIANKDIEAIVLPPKPKLD